MVNIRRNVRSISCVVVALPILIATALVHVSLKYKHYLLLVGDMSLTQPIAQSFMGRRQTNLLSGVPKWVSSRRSVSQFRYFYGLTRTNLQGSCEKGKRHVK